MRVKWHILGITKNSQKPFDSRFDLLSHAARTAMPDGIWFEFGVYRGASINHLANIHNGPIYGFDSFEGLPRSWSPSFGAGAFTTAGNLPSVAPNVVLVKGLFELSLPSFLARTGEGSVSFLHIDCDLYESARQVLTDLKPRIVPGSVIVFDEFVGGLVDDEARAFREFIRGTGHSFRYIGHSKSGSVAILITDQE